MKISNIISDIKLFIKEFLSKFGYILLKNHKYFRPEWTLIHNSKINLLDLLIKLELKNNNLFNFIQIGANDGIHSDPLFKLIRKYKLNGTMIEPIPNIFSKLMQNCEDILDHVDLQNIAITVDGDFGEIPFYFFISDDTDQNQILSGYSSIDKKRLQFIKDNLKLNVNIRIVNVKYESVKHYLKSRNINNINLLVIDVEGLDIDIVTEFLNNGVFPNIIYMEILDQDPDKSLNFANLLSKSGYLIGGNYSDLIAYRETLY